jgi:hypothetical protein
MASLLMDDDTRRARGSANIEGKPVSMDPLAPVRDRADKQAPPAHQALAGLFFVA